MRRVRINGEEHAIPKDQTWCFTTQECLNYPRYMQVTTEYRFQPEPCNYVEIREMRQDIGVAAALEDAKLVVEDDWKDQPREPLAKYLLAQPDWPDQSHLNYGGMKIDFSEHEKRALAALDQPIMANPCAEEMLDHYNPKFLAGTKTGRTSSKPPKPIRRSAVMPNYGYNSVNPVKEAFNSPYQYPSFEQELILAPDGPSETYYQEEEDMRDGPRFHAGTRVIFRSPQTGDPEYGTVVGRVPEMRGKSRPGQYLIASDRASKYNSTHTKYTGRNHGVVMDAKKSGMSEAPHGEWQAVPEHIGVLVATGFIQDDVKFSPHQTGRILSDVQGGMVDVSWNFSNDSFNGRVEDTAGVLRNNVWSVPASNLNMCLLDADTKEATSIWPDAGPGRGKELEKGDLCVVKGRSVSVMNSDDREVILSAGTVVELLSSSSSGRRTWSCKIIGECADNLLNKTVQIRCDYLKDHPFPDNFYRPGQQVEIVAVVDFRKKSLQGMKGRVILSTDLEGDVGIEFKEDIGAGSLDGVGKEGHCVYIEASLVKSSE